MPETSDNHIANFVRFNRKKAGLTQEDLAAKAGVGLRFIRELEQGKQTLRMDKVNQVLNLFGYQVSAGPERKKDPYEILLNNFNRNVHVYLKNRKVLVGFLVEAINNGVEIEAWRFVSNNKAKEYQKNQDENLTQIIPHATIESVENI